jgi:hypothetical protein
MEVWRLPFGRRQLPRRAELAPLLFVSEADNGSRLEPKATLRARLQKSVTATHYRLPLRRHHCYRYSKAVGRAVATALLPLTRCHHEAQLRSAWSGKKSEMHR